MSLFQDPDLVLSATFLSRVAYDDNLGGLTLENALDVEGWDLLDQNELTAYGATGIQNGYFVSQGPGSNGDAVAFAAKSGSTLVLAFRGSDTPGDLFDASFDQEDQIGRLQPFIEAVSGYALDPVNGITKVLITGHSLGGQLTELVLRDEIEADSADRLFVGQGNLQVDFITFSSPGFGDGGATPEYTSIAQDITFLAIGNTGDPVWNKDYPGIIGNFQFGPVVEIDLPEVPGGLLNVAEHSIVFLESQISALVNSQLHDLVSSADQADQDTDPDIQIVLGGQEGVDDIDPTSDDTIDLSMDPGGQSYFIHGLGGQDILSGGPESDAIDGGDENDTIDGGPGGDKIDGGAGIDTVDYSKENGASGVIVILNSDGTGLVSDTHGDVDSLNSIENVIGTDRFDYIVHSDQDGVIDGGTGSDQIFGAGGDDVIYGGDNTDRIEGGAGNNTLYGEGGADLILGGNESDTIFGGENDDQLQGAGSDQASSDMGDQIYGNNGSDLIYGYAGDDTLDGGADNDLLGGAEGQDTLFGGSGSDHLYGGSDSDVLTGGTGGDYFHLATDQWGGGGHASPWLFGSLASGSDTVTDFGAEDFIVFQGQAFAGNIFLDYPSRVAQALGLSAGAVVEESPGTKYVVITLPNGQGSTKFYGDFNLEETGGGWDPDLEFTVPVPDTNYDLQISQGDEGNNFLFGSSDDDQIDGAGGNDFLDGQDGNDNIFGGSGDDELIGGAGDDVLVAGTGFDTLDGGTGNDTYEFAIGDGENIVRDQVGENNTIILTDTLALSDITISASTRVLPDENGDDQTYDVAEVRFEASQQDILVLVGMTQNADGSFSGPFDKIKLSDESELSLSVAPGDVIYGTSGNDNITIVYPTYTDASLFGFSGDDTLIGNAYSNYINGGSGDDYIDGINSSNGNVLEGGSGNDTLIGGGGADILDGGSGNDFLEGRVGADTLDGGLGDDILWVRYEDQVLYGGGGSDEFVMWAGSAVIMDANSNDILKIGGSNIGGVATDRVGNDLQIRVVGLSVPTVIVKDHFIASDKLQAINFIGTGDPDLNQAFDLSLLAVDPVTGGPLSDVLQGTDFDDTIHGGASPDILHGEDGNDLLYGGHGNDFILGGEGDDVIYGGSNHSVSINDTDDFQELLDGGAGSDTIHAGESGYSFYGIAKGGDGNDQIHSTGLSFYASVDGGDGDDVITVATHNTQGDFIGGAGNDVFHINLHSGGKFVGGPGDDTYHINPPPAASNGNWFLNTRIEDTEGSGRIILTDHHYWSPDRVVFERSGDDLRITRTNDDGVVLSSSGITVVDHFSDTASGKISILEFVSGSVFALDNFAPDANSDAVGTGVDQSLVITPELLIANDSDLDGDDVTVLSVTSLGGGNIVVNPDGTFQFTPLPGFDGLATFEYSVEDENGAQSTGKGTVVVGLSGELVYGSDSVDVLDGSSSDEYFLAGDGADIVNADSGDDTLNGQLGADTLYGESGDDVYLFELGDGQDTITENTGQDRIELGPGISQSDLIFSKTSTHLIISIAGTSDSIQITKQYHADSKFHLESLKLDDGTEIDLTGPLPLTGSNGNVTLYGSAGNDTLISADGVTIYRGEKGNDTYDYSFGGANDSIVENTGDDTLSIGSGVTPDEVQIVQTNKHLDITLKSTGIRLRVNNQFNANNKYWIETLVFADGSLWDLVNGVQAGTTGDDSLTADSAGEVVFANGGNDTLASGLGNDELHGGDGDDEYQFGASQGDDLVRDSGGVDKIVLAAGIGLADISMAQVGNDLVVTLNTGETLTVHEHYVGAKSVETLVFNDGMVLDLTKNNVIGTSNAETLNGSASEDVMYGFGGDDTLTAGDGADWLDGGAGNDELQGGGDDDTYFIASGEGNDTIIDSGGADLIQLGPGIALSNISAAQVGDDLVLTVTATSQTITIVNHYHATLGPAERVESLRFDDGIQVDLTVPANEIGNSTTITGGTGDDTFTYTIGDGSFTIEDAGGTDKITLDGSLTDDDFSVSKSGNNLLITITTTGDVITVTDHFNAGTGDTHKIETLEISGGSVFDISPDILEGTVGDDTLTGTGTEQNIFGLDGNDVLTGQNSVADWIIGGAGDDNIDAKSGDDLLYGNAGDDTLTGGGGHDYSYGGAGEDLIKSGGGNDYAYGGADDDDIRAGGGHDYVYGEDGDDNLRGDGGNDQLFGGDGADFLDPGKGTDTITGGAGIDTYNFDKEDEFDGDVITDFVAGVGGESLDLIGLFNVLGYTGTTPVADGYIGIEQSGADTLVKLDPDGGGDGYTSTLTLQNVTAANIVDENIISQ